MVSKYGFMQSGGLSPRTGFLSPHHPSNVLALYSENFLSVYKRTLDVSVLFHWRGWEELMCCLFPESALFASFFLKS